MEPDSSRDWDPADRKGVAEGTHGFDELQVAGTPERESRDDHVASASSVSFDISGGASAWLRSSSGSAAATQTALSGAGATTASRSAPRLQRRLPPPIVDGHSSSWARPL